MFHPRRREGKLWLAHTCTLRRGVWTDGPVDSETKKKQKRSALYLLSTLSHKQPFIAFFFSSESNFQYRKISPPANHSVIKSFELCDRASRISRVGASGIVQLHVSLPPTRTHSCCICSIWWQLYGVGWTTYSHWWVTFYDAAPLLGQTFPIACKCAVMYKTITQQWKR